MRLAIVASHPIQHLCPLYRRLAREPGITLRVFFASRAGLEGYFDPGFNQRISWKQDLLGGYEHEFLQGALERPATGSVDGPDLWQRLEAFSPDAVQVYGFYHRVSRRALAWALWRRRRTLLFADSELRRPRSLLHRLRKLVTVPPALMLVDALLTVGDCNEAYYRHYGASRQKLFRSPFPIDDAALEAAVEQRDRLRREVRQELALEDLAIVVLVVGKLVQAKAPEHAVQGMALLHQTTAANVHLVFAGDGPERSNLEGLAARVLPGRAHFPGFVNVDRLPAFYVAADILLHPSAVDAHPLATSEGVYCGLPAVVSDRVGSVGPSDDVRPGENGLAYPYGDIEALEEALRALLPPSQRNSFSAKSREIGRSRSLEASAQGFVRALTSIL